MSKSYRFGQPIILFEKVDTLRFQKIHIMFCPPSGAKKKYQLMDYEFYKKYPVFSEKRKQSLPKVIIKLPIRSYFLVQASQNVTKDVFSFIFRFSKKNIWCVLKIIFKCHGELKTCPQTSFLKNKIVTTENML